MFLDTKIKRLNLHPELLLPEHDHLFYPLRDSLVEVEMPVIGSSFGQLFGGDHQIEKVTIVGTNGIPKNYFNACGTIEALFISSTVRDVSQNTINCDSLKKLSIPNFEERLDVYGHFPNLEELQVLEKDFHYTLVDHFIDGFEHLTSVTFPNNITRTYSFVISHAPLLKEIIFPESIEAINGPLIGPGCGRLEKIVIPFIGYDVLTPMRYEELNYSFRYTKEVVVLKDFKIHSTTFSLPSIEHLTFKGRIWGEVNGSLKPLEELKYLNLNQEDIPYVGVLFTTNEVNSGNERDFWPKRLNTVIINGNEVER